MDDGRKTKAQLIEELSALRERLGQFERALGDRPKGDAGAMARRAEDLSHDFNNLLTGIMGYANMLRLDAAPGTFAYQAAKTIEQSAERATRLTGEILRLTGIDIEEVESHRGEPVLGSGNVLLVDDEDIICDVAADMLRALGYRVVTVSSGAEAVDYYHRFGHEIDLVIVDMVMPNMDGRECFRKIREIDPGVRTILSTGYSPHVGVKEAIEEGMLGFVQKPYSMERLSAAVHGVLSG